MTPDRRTVRIVPFAELSRARREIDGEIEAVDWLLRYLADHLPAESPTAKAVRRSASWEEVLRIARWEGDGEIAALLEDAMETLLTDTPFRSPYRFRQSP